MPDYSSLNPAVLKPGLTTPDGADLKPGLVTSAYTGGTPTAANQIKPSLRNADGSLKAGLVSGGALKPSLRTRASSFAFDNLSLAPFVGLSAVRRLTQAWTGPLYRVRRDNDNVEMDIGYDSEDFQDEAAALDFVGPNNGFVAKIYDQFGNGGDLAQTNPSAQMRIIVSGSMLKVNGLPAIQGTQIWHMTSGPIFSYTKLSYCGVLRFDLDAGAAFQLGTINQDGSLLRATSLIARGVSGVGNDATIANSLTSLVQCSATYSAAARKIWQNGVAGTQSSQAITFNETNNAMVYNGLSSTVYRMQGYRCEDVWWVDEISDSDRQTIEADQMALYGIT